MSPARIPRGEKTSNHGATSFPISPKIVKGLPEAESRRILIPQLPKSSGNDLIRTIRSSK